MKQQAELQYTVDFFINKFSKIPKYKWGTGAYKKLHLFMFIIPVIQYCAIGRTRRFDGTENLFAAPTGYGTLETQALENLFSGYLHLGVITTNDCKSKRYPQWHPKDRIMAALYDIKRLQEEEQQKKQAFVIYILESVSKPIKLLPYKGKEIAVEEAMEVSID